MTRDFDVIVIGGGGAGMSAALAAEERGARVLIIEADKKLGGSTAMSGGVFYGAATALQRQAGVADTADDQFRYYMNVNQHKLEAALVRRLCDDSAGAFDWLVSLGVSFPLSNLYVSGVDGIARGHRAERHGAEIAERLEAAVSRAGIDVALSARAERVIRDPAGRIAGVEAGGAAVSCAAAVIASGGFGANQRLIAELYPDAARHPDITWYIGSKHCLGDGIEIGRAAGGDLAGFNRGLLLLTPGFARELEPYLPPWLLHVNRDGRRFINEATEYSVLGEVVKEQPGGECFAVFDEAARAAAKPQPAPGWAAERLAGYAQHGTLMRAETLQALAATAGIRAETLANTIAAHNWDCAAGRDTRFFKAAEHLRPVSRPPFYAARIRPAVVCWTGAGLRIDREARVLTAADAPVPGLYAAGEATGGMFGECYAGGGASIANAIIFGRAAGANAAAEAAGAEKG